MSRENVEVVRRAFAYEIYGKGDRAEAEALFDPHIHLTSGRATHPRRGRFAL
ncbi:MAG: hypothetical protein ACRDL1_08860 [Solirubrobacterales bacterium]